MLRSRSLTCCGLALPLLAFMICPHQRVQRFVVAGFEFGHVFGIGSDDFVNNAFKSTGIVHLLEAFGLNDGIYRRAALPQCIKYLFGCAVGNGVVGNPDHQLGQSSCING